MDMIFSNFDKMYAILIMTCVSLYFRFLLQIAGQNWVKTTAHTSTLILLPILTYVITNVISGNIALSLGMVGALSIVRFRNPVRSPLELSVYFGAITMGIAAAVSLKWLIVLLISITFSALILYIISFIFDKFFKSPFFISSFSEGNNLASLIVTSENEITALDKHDDLISKIVNSEGITYTITNSRFSVLKEVEEQISSISNIKNLQLCR